MAVADSLGLDEQQIERTHCEFMTSLIDAALDDHVVTEEEYDQLCRAAALLGIDVAVVSQRTDGHRSAAGDLSDGNRNPANEPDEVWIGGRTGDASPHEPRSADMSRTIATDPVNHHDRVSGPHTRPGYPLRNTTDVAIGGAGRARCRYRLAGSRKLLRRRGSWRKW